MVCIPRKEATSNERLGDLLDKCVREHPDNDAIVYYDRDFRLSWREWGASVEQVAKGLMAMGVQKGDKVAVWATNVPDWITLMFATAKIGAILYLAKALERWGDDLDDFKQFALKIILPIGAICLLILPNSFSSALLIGMISFLILFFMNVNFKNLAITVGALVVVVMLMFGIYHAFFAGRPERQKSAVGKVFNRFGTVENRLTAHFDNEEESLEGLTKKEIDQLKDKDRQSENAKVAISEGGIFGKGPGKSTQRYSLSMAFSDFIYAFIVEEYGLVGGVVVILLYLIFLFRCNCCVRR